MIHRSTRSIGLVLLLAVSGLNLNAAPPPAPGPSVTVSPATLDFGTQAVGTTGSSKAISITNSTASPVSVTQMFTSGIDFSQEDRCHDEMPPGASCTVAITFKPAISGSRIGTFQIYTSEGSAHRVVLTGEGQDSVPEGR